MDTNELKSIVFIYSQIKQDFYLAPHATWVHTARLQASLMLDDLVLLRAHTLRARFVCNR